MPELMENILNNLNNEFYSLYSCTLVSRHWCNMTIPILWRDPFSPDRKGRKPSFISRYLSSLDEDEKFDLKEYGIIIDFPITVFHYARFLKVLDLYRLEDNVQKWINFQYINPNKDINDLKEDIANLLFKLFIKSGTTLSKLNVCISEFVIKPEIFYSLGQNEHFFSRLQDVSVEAISDEYNIDGTIMLLKILAKNSIKIHTLKLNVSEDIYGSQIHHTFASIVRAQEQLKRFNLTYEADFQAKFNGIISALENQRKSLQEIKIHGCAYDAEFEVLMNCEKLEVLRIVYGDEQELLKLLVNGFCKFNTLEITTFQLNAPSIIQFLEKSCSILQRLKLHSDEEIISQIPLLETLTNFCPNITYLYISRITLSIQLVRLIESLKRLEFLTLKWNNYDSEDIAKALVVQLAEKLPTTLQYLYWERFNFQSNSFNDILLDNCDAPLKKLIFYVDCDEKIIKALINFCIRKGTLKYMNDIFRKDFDYLEEDLEGYAKPVPIEYIEVNC
ncbi:4893_t:CDS:1 [Cetraspora pellucida]|uniref:4893_t:CDS:1 n=1 Tax=Cetraspora pellucida TaxID=1433469 RepID=A0ACA9JWC3_9GLOM|nr:4893_t:CDS:1 [Cetraspora pellucida]